MKLKFVSSLAALSAIFFSSAVAQTKLVVKGSDTLGAKMVPQLAEVYKATGNNVNFEIAAEGSSTCFTNLLAGTADFGMSSRAHKDSEAADFTAAGKQLVQHVAGVDMIAVIVNEANGVKSLTKDQVAGVFTGEITDWSEIGGNPGKIAVYTRNTSSGTYKTFQKLAMAGKDYGAQSQKMAGNEQIAQGVSGDIRGIGYVGLAYVGKPGTSPVSVGGILPSPENAKDYPLSRNLYYYTDGQPTGEVKKFIDWSTTSPIAGKIITKVGFLPAN